MTDRVVDEKTFGVITIVTEWRIIDEFPDYEISSSGTVRNRRTKKIRKLEGRSGNNFRYMKAGVRRSVPIEWLRNRTFPEMEPW